MPHLLRTLYRGIYYIYYQIRDIMGVGENQGFHKGGRKKEEEENEGKRGENGENDGKRKKREIGWKKREKRWKKGRGKTLVKRGK